MRAPVVTSLVLASLLAGCDMLGIESASAVAARRDAEGKAIGSACRQAGRAIEDCYTLNKRADKGAVFAGWRDMNDYMRENKMEEVAPQIAVPGAEKKLAKGEEVDAEDEASADASDKRGGAKKKAHGG